MGKISKSQTCCGGCFCKIDCGKCDNPCPSCFETFGLALMCTYCICRCVPAPTACLCDFCFDRGEYVHPHDAKIIKECTCINEGCTCGCRAGCPCCDWLYDAFCCDTCCGFSSMCDCKDCTKGCDFKCPAMCIAMGCHVGCLDCVVPCVPNLCSPICGVCMVEYTMDYDGDYTKKHSSISPS